MKIIDYKTYAVNATYNDYIFTKVFTDEGIYGVGEATMEWKAHATLGAFEDLRPYVIGADPTKIELLFFEAFRQSYWHTDPCTLSAIAALEMACVDITGKKYGLPAHQLFGGKVRDKVKVYLNGWSGMSKTPEEFAAAAKKAVSNGAKALKWDFFGESHLNITHAAMDRAVKSMAAVRDAVGFDIDLLVEAHGRFNVHTALKVAEAMAPYKPFFIEEPTLPDIVEDTIAVHEKSPVPIAAGERLFGKTMFRELIDRNGVDYVQPDMVHCGGMNELKKIGIMAEVHNIQIAPHNPTGPIVTAAYIQICSTMPNFEFLEMMVGSPFRSEITTEKIAIEDGCVTVPDEPGLGIDFNEDIFEKYPPKFFPQMLFSGAF
jgi:galactonate dehydratase